MKKVFLVLFLFVFLFASEYEIGNGYEINKYITIGGYFSTEYEKTDSKESIGIDDIAFLLYGEIDPKINYLLEYEAAGYYTNDIKNDAIDTNSKFHIERAYMDYIYSDSMNIRAGKMITPIGYWNLMPINVLRDTTSNPRLSKEIYPKFITGININGYLPLEESYKYAIFFQNNKDMDRGYNNFDTKEYMGGSVTKMLENSDVGFNIGEFENENDESKNRYFGVNYRYEKDWFEFLSEVIATEVLEKNKKRDAFYLQASKRFLYKHTFVGRYEYFNDRLYDDLSSKYIFGYNYRLIYPVSMKMEYQIDSNSQKNAFVASFSMLF